MKKLILFLSLLALLPAALRAYDFSSENADGVTIYYNIISTDAASPSVAVTHKCGDYVDNDCNRDAYSGTVIIPSTVTHNGTTYSVTSIGGGTFFDCTGLTSIIIPESVTTIGGYAFFGCSGLTSITIPESVTTIGERAFSRCSGLTSISIPEYVTYISYETFSGCSGLTSITIPEAVTYIGSRAFQGCSGLTSITIPNSVTTIGESAFEGCSGLTSITIPEAVTEIGENTFYGCSGLTSITIPESVTTIGSGAFSDCSGLTSITIPESVTTIGEHAFSGCTGLKTLKILNGNAKCYWNIEGFMLLDTLVAPASVLEIEEGDLHRAPQNTHYLHVNGGMISDNGFAVINRQKESLQHIDLSGAENTMLKAKSFYECSKLEKVAFPANMLSIPDQLMAGCKSLKSITIPASVTAIETSAFEDCRSITEIIFEEGSALETISDWAFYNCHELVSVALPEGVKTVGKAAFYDCNKLTDITLPASLAEVGDNGFALCEHLQQMTVRATTPPTIDSKTFYEVDRTIPVYVPESSVADYKADPYWGEFNIQGAPDIPTATDPITTTPTFTIDGNSINFPTETQISIYTTTGLCIYTGTTTTVILPTSGIYIVVTPTTTQKVSIR